MAISLNATLNTAQESASRHPIVEIKSHPQVSDIPFLGQLLTDNTINEKHPSVIAHSDGRLCLGFRYGQEAGAYLIKYYYTDIIRNEWSHVDINVGTDDFTGLCLCEMTGGNIGMVYLVNDTGNTLYRLKYRIITKLGVAVSDGEIANWANTITTGDPWVLTITTNSYIVVYTKFVVGDSHYHFYKRTSANFTAWAGEAEMAVGNLTDTKEKRNPSLILLDSGDIWLWFDYVEATITGGELTNVYYSISADNGGTWANAEKVTSYTQYSEIANHPVAVQKIADEQYLLFTRMISALQMDDTETGWLSGDTPGNLCFDAVDRKLYVTNVYSAGGAKKLQCVVKIDVDTWTVDDCWDITTAPAFNSDVFSASQHVWYKRDQGERYLIPISNKEYNVKCVALLNADADTITHYYFLTIAGWGITQNVTWTSPSEYAEITHTQIDLANNRLWVCMIRDNINDRIIFIGYLDLTEGSEPYSFTEVINETNTITQGEAGLVGISGDGHFEVRPDDDMIILSGGDNGASQAGFLRIWTMEGAIWKYYNYSLFSSFPYHGLYKFEHYYGGKIYAGINYTASYGQEDYRGLVEIDLSLDTFTYHRPSYASIDDYNLADFCPGEPNKIICAHYAYGIAIYDISNDSWILYSNSNIPGLTSSGEDDFWYCVYDDENDMIITGHGTSLDSWQGIVMISLYGAMQQSAYTIGTNSGGTWSWSSIAPLVQGYKDYEAVGWVDPGDSGSMYVFWTSVDLSNEYSIKWAKDGSIMDLSPYLTVKDEVTFERSIDGKASRLSFTLAAGHLFDPYNMDSLFSSYVKKGRKITLRFGEIVASVEYWQAMGTVIISEAKLRYERGKYTTIKVIAEDERVVWENNHIYATEYFQAFPEDIISSVLQAWAGIDSGDISISNFSNRKLLEHQWIETTLFELIDQICDRFGYYLRFDVDHVVKCKRINYNNSVDHTYTSANKIINYEPDDRYSDFTNRVTVTGQELTWIDVTYPEERVGYLNGTCGWYGFKKDYNVYYSPDGSRRCKNPRLNVVETVTSIPFKLVGSIHERISSEDTVGYKYCTVSVEAPNLVPLLVGALIALGATWYVGDIETNSKYTISFGKILTNLQLSFVLAIISSIGNFQYEIYATPMGKVRRSVQASANDTESQTELGCIIEKKLEDPMCYSQADCAIVADHELMVTKYQRRRIKITKIAHLQDEDGDTLQFFHPYTGLTLKIFVTNITRRYKKASGPNKNDGYFFDDIEGWVVSAL